ncbi:MAG: gas vesicle protein GvpG [Gammaproteobacteria bacterium]|nr:gas vesicle protein GvpG [Gemmatimonadota bacterium]NIU75461.1 gas vesicle protein GvpG [Gammaproteobacteria bacterium]NIY09445.1 gas vesicle protein GvpG [Gemmatimonadota bacterium]
MGVLKHLLFWPVTGPSFLTRFSLEKVGDAVRTELTDDAAVKEELMALQLQLELGTITEEEYTTRETELMDRLRRVREWRERYGLPTGGGPVRVVGRDSGVGGSGS